MPLTASPQTPIDASISSFDHSESAADNSAAGSALRLVQGGADVSGTSAKSAQAKPERIISPGIASVSASEALSAASAAAGLPKTSVSIASATSDIRSPSPNAGNSALTVHNRTKSITSTDSAG